MLRSVDVARCRACVFRLLFNFRVDPEVGGLRLRDLVVQQLPRTCEREARDARDVVEIKQAAFPRLVREASLRGHPPLRVLVAHLVLVHAKRDLARRLERREVMQSAAEEIRGHVHVLFAVPGRRSGSVRIELQTDLPHPAAAADVGIQALLRHVAVLERVVQQPEIEAIAPFMLGWHVDRPVGSPRVAHRGLQLLQVFYGDPLLAGDARILPRVIQEQVTRVGASPVEERVEALVLEHFNGRRPIASASIVLANEGQHVQSSFRVRVLPPLANVQGHLDSHVPVRHHGGVQ
mmetsp:Transcript_9832/g.37055  ORF Transcript_9832/g.37055 Transcript_9832/m.37055 type:complete len:292 (+) Transcript_9832:981-1856(+)